MRNLLVAVILMLTALPLLAEKKERITEMFVVQSVTLTGDNCILSVKDGNVIYVLIGRAHLCADISSGTTLSGFIDTNGWMHFLTGTNPKTGRPTWTPPFTIYSKHQ
jgi:hypothetical protein